MIRTTCKKCFTEYAQEHRNQLCPHCVDERMSKWIKKETAIEAIGWAYADCCSDLDKGLDPRKTEISDVIKRAEKDLKL